MPSDIRPIWGQFVKAVQALLVPQVDDRPLDQYLAFRDTVLALVQSEDFLGHLNNAWTLPNGVPNVVDDRIRDGLIQEIQAFLRAAEVAQVTQKPEESKGWWRKTLGHAATVTGSVKDILGDPMPFGKHALTLFKELIDIFRGKD